MQEIPTKAFEQQSAFPAIGKEIDFRSLIYMALAEKWFILGVALVIFFLGTIHALGKTQQYQADVLLQVTDKHGGMGALGTLPFASPLSGGGHPADIQTVLIKSRFILIPAIKALHLDITVKPHYFHCLVPDMHNNIMQHCKNLYSVGIVMHGVVNKSR